MTTDGSMGSYEAVQLMSGILAGARALADGAPAGECDGPEGSWGYVLAKVLRYLETGPEVYRRDDALGVPPESWSPWVLEAVQAGMEQLRAGKGLVRRAPIEGLDVPAVHALMHVLHFGLEVVESARLPDRRFLDQMRFRHAVVPGQFVVVYAAFAPEIDELDAELDEQEPLRPDRLS